MAGKARRRQRTVTIEFWQRKSGRIWGLVQEGYSLAAAIDIAKAEERQEDKKP